jgi:hypothetical protein
MGKVALAMTRAMLLWGAVAMPMGIAIGVAREPTGWPWLRYVVPPLALMVTIAGIIYSNLCWRDPPAWAVFFARTWGYRDQWHRPVDACAVDEETGAPPARGQFAWAIVMIVAGAALILARLLRG